MQSSFPNEPGDQPVSFVAQGSMADGEIGFGYVAVLGAAMRDFYDSMRKDAT